MVLPLLAVLTGCESEAEYTAAEALTSAQVFFDNELPSTQNIDINATSFDVPVNRANTKGELTVAISSEQDEDNIFTIPTSVTFADGADQANVTITYPEGSQEYDVFHTITLKVAEEKDATPYGSDSYTFQAGPAAPWTPWVSTASAFAAEGGQGDFPLSDVGTGDYTYSSVFFGPGDDPGLEISFRQNKLNPNQGEFKIENWGYGVDLVLTGEWDEVKGLWRISVPLTFTGYVHSSYGNVYFGDWAAYYEYTDREPPTWDELYAIDQAGTYDPQSGLFRLFVRYFVEAGSFGGDYEYFQVHGFYIPDYSVIPTFEGVLTKDDLPYAQVSVEFGTDVQKVLAYIVDAKADAAAVADALADGEVEGVELVAGINNIPLGDETGELQVVIASLVEDEEGTKVKDVSSVKFAYYGGGKNPWTALGTGYFTDDMILPLFGYDAEDYPVEIEESNETPGVYRLLAMYSAVAADFGVESGTGDVIVNAEDPDAVYILPQPLELTIGSNGPFSISTDAGEYVAEYGFDIVKAQLPEIFATLKDGVISFPVLSEEREDGSTMNYQLWAVLNGRYYYAGRAGQFKIVLPEAAAEVKAKAASAARAKNFRARLTAKPGHKRADLRKMMGKSMKMSHRNPVLKKSIEAIAF